MKRHLRPQLLQLHLVAQRVGARKLQFAAHARELQRVPRLQLVQLDARVVQPHRRVVGVLDDLVELAQESLPSTTHRDTARHRHGVNVLAQGCTTGASAPQHPSEMHAAAPATAGLHHHRRGRQSRACDAQPRPPSPPLDLLAETHPEHWRTRQRARRRRRCRCRRCPHQHSRPTPTAAGAAPPWAGTWTAPALPTRPCASALRSWGRRALQTAAPRAGFARARVSPSVTITRDGHAHGRHGSCITARTCTATQKHSGVGLATCGRAHQSPHTHTSTGSAATAASADAAGCGAGFALRGFSSSRAR